MRPRADLTALCATLALVGFAANQLLCRMALRPDLIDALSFTAVRLSAGALTLLLLARAARKPLGAPRFGPAGALLVYALAFSLAYRDLQAGTGALILFGTVQLTMLGWGVLRGERPGALEWLGLVISLAGLIALVLPSVAAPPLGAAGLMVLAGVGWAAYSLLGRHAPAPLAGAAASFLWSAPPAVALALATSLLGSGAHSSARGLAYAASSGALASGVGYALWYAALPRLTAARAAILQLAVPVVATLGGVILLAEALSLRVALAGAAILAGIAVAIAGSRGN